MTAHTIPPEPKRTRGAYKNVCVSITPEADAVVKQVGDGSRSRGIRELVRYWLRGEQEVDP